MSNETWNILNKRQKKMMGIAETKVSNFLRMRSNNQDKVGFAFEKLQEVETYIQRAIKDGRDMITLKDLTEQGFSEILPGRNLGDFIRFLRHPKLEGKKKLPKGLNGKIYYQSRLNAKKNDTNPVAEFIKLAIPTFQVAYTTATGLVLYPFRTIPEFIGIDEKTAEEGLKIIKTISGKQTKTHKKMNLQRTGRTILDKVRK
ncbi:MAG: hypothetical protein JXA54_11300 [Candidatus Heimdallarchaeota archaeon]|nr:hypothetical protein [Candidatus Heimdallarchaeota archaeon]